MKKLSKFMRWLPVVFFLAGVVFLFFIPVVGGVLIVGAAAIAVMFALLDCY